MNFDIYETQINEKLKAEMEKVLSKEELTIDEVKLLMDILTSNRIKKMSSLI